MDRQHQTRVAGTRSRGARGLLAALAFGAGLGAWALQGPALGTAWAQATATAPATGKADIPVNPAIAAWAEGYVTSGKLAGLVTLVARDGKIVHQSAHGVRDLDSGVPMTAGDLFRIYSMTKPITSVGVMILVEEGKIDLDAPIETYLPAFEDMDVFKAQGEDGTMETEALIRPVSVRDLLRHTAGMTYGIFGDHPVDRLYREAGILNPADDNEAFTDKLADQPLMLQPGTRWHYSVSVDLQGRLIEVVSGQRLDRFFKDRIFDPLGMDETAFFAPQSELDRLATVYAPPAEGAEDAGIVVSPNLNDAGVKTPDFNFMSGGGGLVSTAADYLRFCQMMLNGGELDGARILKTKTVDDMRRNHLPEALVPFSPRSPGQGFGLGFAVVMDPQKPSDNAGRYYWGGAASTVFWIDPEDDTIAILMTQFGPSNTYPLRSEFEALVHPAD